MKHIRGVSILLFVVGAGAAIAGHHEGARHKVIPVSQVQWQDVSAEFGPGVHLSVLEGDPSTAGSTYTVRVRFADGYLVPPHWHPVDENLVVLQGTFHMGMGEKFDRAGTQPLATGAFATIPKEMRHFAWAEGETILQLHGIGPFQINYVNPEDDPKNRAMKTTAQ